MITPSLLRTALETRVEKYFEEAPELVKSSVLAENILALVSDLRLNPKKEKLWLVLTMLTGHLPTVEQISKAELWLRSSQSDAELGEKLLGELTVSSANSAASTDVVIVKDCVIVLLVNIVKHDLHTGVQRVARSLCSELIGIDQNIVFANLSDDGFSISPIDNDFMRKVLSEEYRLSKGLNNQAAPEKVLVPLSCKILLPEVPLNIEFNSRLSALADNSSNSLACIGYDLIPILSPEFVSRLETEQFTHYLSMVSRTKKVLCISELTAAEFRGFFQAKESIGASSPKISVFDIPVDRKVGVQKAPRNNSTLNILTVGTIEPRKGQVETLLACKKLWKEDYALKITFVGKVHPEIDDVWSSLTRGLSKTVFSHKMDLSEQELAQLYSTSDLSIFVSKHEGYGLPIVESIMHGTPVLTTNFNPAYLKVKNSGATGISIVDSETIANELRKIFESFSKDGLLESVNQDFEVPSAFEYASEIYREILEL